MGAKTPSLQRRQAFCALIEQHRRIVLKITHTYCRNQADREDLGQEIIGQLWRAFPSYDPARSFSTWMYRIALNVAISRMRYQVRRPTVPLGDAPHELADGADDALEHDQRVLALYRFIDALDEMNRALLLLYLEDHSNSDIADILGITATNVSTKLNRLKNRMKGAFGDDTDRLETSDGNR
ncbi:RNA polymerase sigma factor [Paraliomyxa miuraensis]|uniref:RNA polymerase sigma factor n=1 Tax=Paraliomyxa miuraensis TaxID=376150 RepID=UPI00225AF24E|nr:sigma-70 family RNA polymerase sigma factor [Paraliomyxa miuraensis]MCX4247954.1 sigma-70 family RNA polymerase sigma factor [Paraliomyxa miuraensis]